KLTGGKDANLDAKIRRAGTGRLRSAVAKVRKDGKGRRDEELRRESQTDTRPSGHEALRRVAINARAAARARSLAPLMKNMNTSRAPLRGATSGCTMFRPSGTLPLAQVLARSAHRARSLAE